MGQKLVITTVKSNNRVTVVPNLTMHNK